MERAADDFAAIAQRLREIAADREEAQKQRADEPPADTQWDALLAYWSATTPDEERVAVKALGMPVEF